MTNLVTVGCKLPNGLILEMGKAGSEQYKRVVLNGANSAKIVGGYGLTDVDADFMAAWLKKYAWLAPVKNGMVFVQSDVDNATAQALDKADAVSGFERLDPKRAPKGIEADPDHMKQALREAPQLANARSA
jgi:hypothetical protein